MLQGKEFIAAHQNVKISYENKQIPKILKVSQKLLWVDTLMGVLLLVSRL